MINSRSSTGDESMTFVEFAEKISPIPLPDWEKVILAAYEKAQKENKELIVVPAGNTDRKIVLQIIDDWNGLKEHRCSCGRLLGKFNGQAEVKCPKCGKMNMIGAERHVDSGSTR